MQVVILVVFTLVVLSTAQMDQPPPSEAIYRKDVPFLKCGVCQTAMGEVWEQAQELRARHKKGEEIFLELTENVCDPLADEGEWISMYDVVVEDNKLVLDYQEWYGFCRRECRTIAAACKQTVGELDQEIALALFLNDPPSQERLTSRVCKKWAEACPTKKELKGRYLKKRMGMDEPWQPMTEEDVHMRYLQRMTHASGQNVKFVDPDAWMENSFDEMMDDMDWDDDWVDSGENPYDQHWPDEL